MSKAISEMNATELNQHKIQYKRKIGGLAVLVLMVAVLTIGYSSTLSKHEVPEKVISESKVVSAVSHTVTAKQCKKCNQSEVTFVTWADGIQEKILGHHTSFIIGVENNIERGEDYLSVNGIVVKKPLNSKRNHLIVLSSALLLVFFFMLLMIWSEESIVEPWHQKLERVEHLGTVEFRTYDIEGKKYTVRFDDGRELEFTGVHQSITIGSTIALILNGRDELVEINQRS